MSKKKKKILIVFFSILCALIVINRLNGDLLYLKLKAINDAESITVSINGKEQKLDINGMWGEGLHKSYIGVPKTNSYSNEKAIIKFAGKGIVSATIIIYPLTEDLSAEHQKYAFPFMKERCVAVLENICFTRNALVSDTGELLAPILNDIELILDNPLGQQSSETN